MSRQSLERAVEAETLGDVTKIIGDARGERAPLASRGRVDAELPGVQQRAVAERARGTLWREIGGVANDWRADSGEMRADLVRASGERRDEQQRVSTGDGKRAIGGLGGLPIGVSDDAAPVFGVAHKRRDDLAGLRGRRADREREVLLVDRATLKLANEGAASLNGLGEDDDT